MEYDLNVTEKHKKLHGVVEKEFKKLRKQIGYIIFSYFEIYENDDGDINYYLARKIYNRIINENADDLKRVLSMSGIHMINDLITDEYSTILKLQHKIDDLEKRLNFYKQIVENIYEK